MNLITKQIAFFRGLPLPVLSLPLNNSMLFGVYGYSLSYLNNGNRNEREANVKSIYFSGIVGKEFPKTKRSPFEIILRNVFFKLEWLQVFRKILLKYLKYTYKLMVINLEIFDRLKK